MRQPLSDEGDELTIAIGAIADHQIALLQLKELQTLATWPSVTLS
jgi:hypothetical protein